jgi:hypothetical protein
VSLPELAVKQSGYGGRGYVIPAIGDEPFKIVTNAGVKIKGRLGEDGNKIVVPSVTTVLKAAAQPGITQWAVDNTAAYAVANIDALLSRSETQGFGFLRWYYSRDPRPLEKGLDLRNYHLGVLNDAAEMGTTIHEWAEADVNPTGIYPDTSTQGEPFWQMVERWNEWYGSNFIVPKYTELTVWNKDEGYAGTLDFLWEINGRLTLGDIKSSRSLWPEHSRQIAALASATHALARNADGEWEEWDWQETMKDVESTGFLHVRPDDVDNQGNDVPSYIEWVEAEDLDLHYQAFLGCLNIKKAEIAVAARQKARTTSAIQSSSEATTP